MKRAYLALALRYHPDRAGSESTVARETAAFRMQEVNAAWAVLRDPAARGRYDEYRRLSLVGADVVDRPRTTASEAGRPAGAPRGVPLRPVTRPVIPAVALEPDGPAEARRRWHLPLLVALAAVAIVAIAGAVTTRPDDRLGVRTVEPFAVGTCVALVQDPAAGTAVAGEQARPLVVEVPCSGPHSARVVDKQPFPKPCPPGSRAFVMASDSPSLCLVS